jgi:hypothetical protein
VFARLPFTLLHLTAAKWPIFSVNLMLIGIMAVNALALERGRSPPRPFWVLYEAQRLGRIPSSRLRRPDRGHCQLEPGSASPPPHHRLHKSARTR